MVGGVWEKIHFYIENINVDFGGQTRKRFSFLFNLRKTESPSFSVGELAETLAAVPASREVSRGYDHVRLQAEGTGLWSFPRVCLYRSNSVLSRGLLFI